MSMRDKPARPIRRDAREVTRDDREVIERAMFGFDRLAGPEPTVSLNERRWG